MNTFADMSERHGYGLMRLAEMAGTLVEQAYRRASVADTPPEKDQAALVFDRLARGFRLTVMLEARMAREQRRDAREIERFAAEPVTAGHDLPALAASRPEPRPERHAETPSPRAPEADRECESDPETSEPSLDGLSREFSSLLDDHAAALDPDGSHRATLADIADWWAKGQHDAPRPDQAGDPPTVRPRTRRPRRRPKHSAGPVMGSDPPWRSSG